MGLRFHDVSRHLAGRKVEHVKRKMRHVLAKGLPITATAHGAAA